MTDNPTLAAINAAYRNSVGAWFESPNCKIWPKDRSSGLITPKQNYLQQKSQRVFDRFEDLGLPIRVLGLKPRQRGSSTIYAAADYHHLRRKAAHACIIGGQISQTNQIGEMIKTFQANDRLNWGNTGEINSKEGRWTNGSRLTFETAGDKLAGVSLTIQALHATEVARWSVYGVSNASEVLANILKCVPVLPDTMVILESTAEGAVGDFYTRWLGAVDAEDFLDGTAEIGPGQYCRIFSPWFEFEDSAMRLDEDQKRAVESSLDAEEEYIGERELIELYGKTGDDGVMRLGTSVANFDVWEQLYWRRFSIREECKRDRYIFDRDFPRSWLTAFQKSGNVRFNQTGMAMMRKRLASCRPEHGLIEQTKERRFVFRRTEIGEAKFSIFEKAIPGCRYILPVDPMTGETQVGGKDPDRHGAFVLRAGYWGKAGKWHRMATAARIVPNRWDVDVLEEGVWALSRLYGGLTGCMIAIEMNQDRGLTELLKLRSANLYQREIFNSREMRLTKALGYQTNQKTREILVESLAKVVREWDSPGDGIDILCPHALEQSENFVRKAHGRSEHADGWHDDDVFAIGLGVELIDHATTYVPPADFFGVPDFARQNKSEQVGSGYS